MTIDVAGEVKQGHRGNDVILARKQRRLNRRGMSPWENGGEFECVGEFAGLGSIITTDSRQLQRRRQIVRGIRGFKGGNTKLSALYREGRGGEVIPS